MNKIVIILILSKIKILNSHHTKVTHNKTSDLLSEYNL